MLFYIQGDACRWNGGCSLLSLDSFWSKKQDDETFSDRSIHVVVR